MVIAFVFLGGNWGWIEGMFHSCEVILRENPIGKEWLPQAGFC